MMTVREHFVYCQFDKELKTVNDLISHPFPVDHLMN